MLLTAPYSVKILIMFLLLQSLVLYLPSKNADVTGQFSQTGKTLSVDRLHRLMLHLMRDGTSGSITRGARK